MPTIDIPDKICAHCGGIRWSIAYRKNKNPQYTCISILKDRERQRYLADSESYKERAKKSRLWLIKDPEVMKRRYAKQREWKRNNPDKVRSYKRKTDSKIRSSIADEYVKRQIIQLDGYENLSFKDIPQKLIDIKRKQLLITRQIKQLKNEKINKKALPA